MLLKSIVKQQFSQFLGHIRKILICPDKFKFSLTSTQVSDTIRNSLPQYINSQAIILADGGDGSLEAISIQLQGKWVSCQVLDPFMRSVHAEYFQSKEKESFIEMARASGLALIIQSQRNPLKTTTFGTGQLILDSLERGNKNINLFIGGSATNDGGIGCAAALGFKFFSKNGQELSPVGGNLDLISSFEQTNTKIKELLKQSKITVYTDVLNPLLGVNGATYVYGPQKGVTDQMAKVLDKGLDNLNNLFKQKYGIDTDKIPGSGGAGGLGAGCLAFLKADLKRGIDLVFRITEFERLLDEVDLVITGEGKFDGQTLEGKVVMGVIERCLVKKKKVIVLSAIVEQKGDFPWSQDQVKVIQILTQSQKRTVDPEVTRNKIFQTIKSLFPAQR